jgi:hypothetical protein
VKFSALAWRVSVGREREKKKNLEECQRRIGWGNKTRNFSLPMRCDQLKQARRGFLSVIWSLWLLFFFSFLLSGGFADEKKTGRKGE